MKFVPKIFMIILLISNHLIAQNALNFDGVNDYVQTTFPGISGTNSRTVEAWIKGPLSTSQEVIIDWGDMSIGHRFTVNLIGGKLRCEIGGSGVTGTTLVADNTWHHIAVTFNNSSANKYNTYVDGVLEASFNLPTTINTSSTNNLIIGRRNDAVNYYTGTIDEVRIWNTDLTATQINANKNLEFCGPLPNLVAYYKLNNGVAGGNNFTNITATDYSGNNNDGTLNGFNLSGSTSNWVVGSSSISASSIQGGVDTVTACIPYILPSGKKIFSTSIVSDTALNTFGCDSIYSVNFTAIPNPISSFSTTVCDGFYSPSGSYFNKTGTYVDTLNAIAGCDSLISIALTVNSSKLDVQNISACKSYVSPLNKTYTLNGTYFDTLTTLTGCDSIIVTNLTITSDYIYNSNSFVCDSFKTVLGNIITTAGSYSDTVFTGSGCDSIFNYNLSFGYTTFSNFKGLGCSKNYVSDLGNVYDSSGVYKEYTMNKMGCDSIITITVKLAENKLVQTRDTICREAISPSGKFIWNTSGWNYDTVSTINNCDSFIQTYVVINDIDTEVVTNGNKLTVKQTGVNYQWLNCDGFTEINSATNRSFTASENGNYAVVVYDGICRDTTSCKAVIISGINDISKIYEVSIYPNPSSGIINISSNQSIEKIEVVNILGEILISEITNHQILNFSSIDNGLYFLKVRFTSGDEFQQKLLLSK